jgi:hypothetical protein
VGSARERAGGGAAHGRVIRGRRGSVELLYDKAAGFAYYFDLNMLSTLPDADRIRDPENLWRDGRDFYREHMDCILKLLPAARGG